MNRGNARTRIFYKDADYEAFERILGEAKERYDMRVLAYCLMSNHWHLVLWPRHDGDLSRFMGWLTLTHTQRCHAHRGTGGTGHVYQGRFKSFPVQADDHFVTVCRYVERNALRADLVKRAEQWRWCSLWRRVHRDAAAQELLSDWPVRCPREWNDWVNEPETEQELEAIRRSIMRGSPYGEESWVERVAKRLGLEITLRPRGRPRKVED